jgi:hypothetical protein
LLDRIRPVNFEKLAEEAGLAKPLVKKRVPELASLVIEALKTIDMDQPDALKVLKIVQERSAQAISFFKNS